MMNLDEVRDLLRGFEHLPKTFAGTSFRGTFRLWHLTSPEDDECEALDLPMGETIKCWAKFLVEGEEDPDLTSINVYATGEMAQRCLRAYAKDCKLTGEFKTVFGVGTQMFFHGSQRVSVSGVLLTRLEGIEGGRP